jgi:hypothetical protein
MDHKRPPVAGARSCDLEFLKIWGPENHKVVLAEFAISGLQCLRRAIVPNCFLSDMEAFFWLIGENKNIELATSEVMAVHL